MLNNCAVVVKDHFGFIQSFYDFFYMVNGLFSVFEMMTMSSMNYIRMANHQVNGSCLFAKG